MTCDELNIMQEAAVSIDGCYGARMVGGGFGGCVIALVDQDRKKQFMEEIKQKYDSHEKISHLNIHTEVWEAVSGDGIKIEQVEEQA